MNAKFTLEDTADMSSLSVSSESETTLVSLTEELCCWTASSPIGSFQSESAFLALVLLESPPPIDGCLLFCPPFHVQNHNQNNSITPNAITTLIKLHHDFIYILYTKYNTPYS